MGLEAFDLFKSGSKLLRSGKNVKGAIESGDWRDWVTTGSPIAALGTDLYAKHMKNVADDAAKSAYKELADILGWYSTILSVLEFTMLGWGSPEKGKDVKTAGTTSFKSADENLTDSTPDDDEWSGEGADAYTNQVTLQKERLEKIKKIDKELVEIMSTNADQLTNLRLGFTVSQDFLSMMAPPALALLATPVPPNKLASNAFQISICLIVTTYIASHMSMMAGNASVNATKVQKAITDYTALATGAVPPAKSPYNAKAPGGTQTTVSSFEEISASLSEFAIPEVATLANTPEARASMTPEQQALMGALSGDSALTGTGAGATAGATLPSLSQVAKASGQLSQIISQPMNLGQQAVQQISQLAQQARSAAPPAKEVKEVAPEEPARAEDELVAAGAPAPGAAGEGGERAPVGATTVGAEQAQEPSPVTRTV